MLKWYLSALKRQQYSGGSEKEGVKKPLNPFLGELFVAQYKDESGLTKLVSEQVSHHPPVTACYLWNEKHGVRAEGYTAQEIYLSKTGSVNITQIGHAFVHLDGFQESYLVTLPLLTVKGLLSGTPYPELTGTSYIASSTGFTSKIDYSGASWLPGSNHKRNTFDAELYMTKDPSQVLYKVHGQWNSTFTFHDVVAGQDIETYDTEDSVNAPSRLIIQPPEDQDSWESQRTWQAVHKAIKKGDWKATSSEKNKIEEAQRSMRKKEKEEGRSWQAAMFSRVDDDPLFEGLKEGTGQELQAERTAGVWKFDHEKAKTAHAPYHGDLTPLG